MVKTRSATASTTSPSPRRLRSSTLAKRRPAKHAVIPNRIVHVANRENATPQTPRASRKGGRTERTNVTKIISSNTIKRRPKPNSVLTERDASKGNTEQGFPQNATVESIKEDHLKSPPSATSELRVPLPTVNVPTLKEAYLTSSATKSNVIAPQVSDAEVETEEDFDTTFHDGLPARNKGRHPLAASDSLPCWLGKCQCKCQSIPDDELGRLLDIFDDTFIEGNASMLSMYGLSNLPRTVFQKPANPTWKEDGFPFLCDDPTPFRLGVYRRRLGERPPVATQGYVNPLEAFFVL